MSSLPSLNCPSCGEKLIALSGSPLRAGKYDDCLRLCKACGIGASNAADPRNVTYIHRDPLGNIPIESREGASEALGLALNIWNRESKRQRFGFSTSEDAVTWVVFSYLLRSGQLHGALQRCGLITECSLASPPTLLLWGVPIGDGARGAEIRIHLSDLCANLHEDQKSFSEPDVIIDLGECGLIFIEVKHRSGNDSKPADYPGWTRYQAAAWLAWKIEDVKASGCYELARNWCLLKKLAGDRPATLVNLGPAGLFSNSEGKRLDDFVNALGTDDRSHFIRLTWSDLLEKGPVDVPPWFTQFCRGRCLIT